ncbi:MAG: regulatory protein RecX [Clostridia bacterium]|nr:regulatory protein RecX [Clostridia bacterium]
MNERKITALRKQRGRLYCVTLADGEEVTLDSKTLDDNGVGVGTVLTETAWEQLCDLCEQNRAREKALWLLSRRDYSVREMTGKLRETADREVAAAVSARLEEVGLINDERYAERLVREYCLVRQYPMRRAEQKMREKGLSREWIEAAFETCEIDDVQLALAHLEKLCYTDTDNEETRRKLRDKLVRYGFSYETVRTAIRIAEENAS